MLQEAVSGRLVGKGDNYVVIFDKENGSTKSLKIRGRYMYVKKCRRPTELEGIALPIKSQGQTTVCLVLAIGYGVGKFHELTKDDEVLNKHIENSLFAIKSCSMVDVKVGDKVFFPDEDPYGAQKGISRMPYGVDEFIIHECLAIGKVEE